MNKSNILAAILIAFSGITAQAVVFPQPDFNSLPQPRYSYHYDDPLVEAQMIAVEISGQFQPPEELTQQILNDLAIIRATYPDMADISYFPSYAPKEMIAGLTEAAVEQFKAGNYHGLDILNEQYGVVAIDSHYLEHGLHFIKLTFDKVYNMEFLSDIYEQAHPNGLDHVNPNHTIGDGSTIIAEPPHYTFAERWGDCPAGCTQGRNWNFIIENGQATLQVEKPTSVTDNKRPHFRLRVRPKVLKPKNDEMVRVSVEWTVRDNIDPSPEVSLVNIVVVERGKIIADVNNTDMNSIPPISIAFMMNSAKQEQIIADMWNSDDIRVDAFGAIYLRATSTNVKFRRTYVLTYQAQDNSGNVTIRRAKVYVSRGQVKKIQGDPPFPVPGIESDFPVPTAGEESR